MKIIIRIGGSVLASPPNSFTIEKYASLLKDLRVTGHEVVVVVGGGSVARDFIRLADELGLSENEKDEVAISVSRLIAQLLSIKLGDLGSKLIPRSIEEASLALKDGDIVAMGGLKPGMTTDTVAAMIGEKVGADLLVKATDQDGIYTKDPEKYSDSKKIDEISFEDLIQILKESRHTAGIHQILDYKAILILQKSGIKTVVVNGFKPKNIMLAVREEKVGTIITTKKD
jgi:uridylate kinase